jgi:hypothetical protein
MTTMNKSFLTIMLSLLLIACNSIGGQKKNTTQPNDLTQSVKTTTQFNDRFFIVGDFNGDNLLDTIFESYKSSLTNKVAPKEIDSNNFEKNIELIIKNKPVTMLYSSIAGVDTLIVTKEYQQIGLRNFVRLGDLNSDKSDEFGYIINWADFSNLNTFHILTIKDNKFIELFNFKINESVNLDLENLFENEILIKSIEPKTIEYKFYSDSATVETGRHTFN